MPDLIMHINYFEQPGIAVAFDKAVRYGFGGIELRGALKDMDRESYLTLVRKQADRTGITNVIFGVPCDLTMADREQRKTNVEDAIDLLRRTAERGTTRYNTYAGSLLAPNTPYTEFHKNGSAAASEDQWEWAAEGYRQIGSVAEKLGVKLGFETHNCYIHDLAAPTKKLLDMIGSPAIGANLDIGNIILNQNGESMDELFSILRGCIHYAHLKNVYRPSVGGYIVCGMADGVIDNRDFVRRLKESGYEGPLCLEAPRPGDRDHFAQSDLAYVQRICEELRY